MLKGEDKAYEKRHSLCVKFRDMNLSYSTRIELTKSMDGQTETTKEKIAEQLLQIISESKTEKEMLEKASQIRI